MPVVSAVQEKNNLMFRYSLLICSVAFLFIACRSTKNIQKAISKKEGAGVVSVIPTHADTVRIVNRLLDSMYFRQALFSTFSAKIKVEYTNEKGKQPDFTAHIRMHKDSLIWISLSNDIGIEGLRIYIDKDSIRVLDKLANTYQIRPLSSIQEVSQLPFAMSDLQNLLLGVPVFFTRDSILNYNYIKESHDLLSSGKIFRHLLTLGNDFEPVKSKLDDVDPLLNRTANLTYSEYEVKEGVWFSTLREIFISTKGTLGIKLKFKDYKFNEVLSFPFTIPKKFKRVK